MDLMEHQSSAVDLLGNGKILYGAVGTGKSATALAYYMKEEHGRDIIVITTAKKRDSLDWLAEGARFGIGTERSGTVAGTITVDSWNNIAKYKNEVGAFFIFDEQRLVGSGSWVKSFLHIVRRNRWILLTATPGDTWIDYAPVFVANGWYKNITQFKREHVIYAPYVKFPMIQRYVGTAKLERLRNEILVEMIYQSHTVRILNYIDVCYDHDLWDMAVRRRWHPYESRPIADVGELFRVMRRIAYTDPSRLDTVKMFLKCHPKLIVFYTFNYELDILRTLSSEITIAEWNGHKKEPVPDTDRWVYLVQYTSGSEGWNCTETDAMMLYSMTYSYKNFVQSQGRIDRIDSPFTKLYYYILTSNAPIDIAVRKALSEKKSFNEREEAKKWHFPANNF